MNTHTPRKIAGVTLNETSMAMLISGFVMIAVLTFISSGMLAFARNYSTNSSHLAMRESIDRISNSISSAAGQVRLVNSDGTTVASGSAAGIRYDQFVGGPYVVSHPGGTGIIANSTSITIIRSVDAAASPPIPAPGDTILVDGTPTRLVVGSVTNGTVNANSEQSHTITLSAPPGVDISWTTGSIKVANLFRAAAFVVVPNGERNELRHYQRAELITNFTTSSAYVLVCNNIGTQTTDSTPFSLSTENDSANRKFLNLTLRIRAREFDSRLFKSEQTHFSSAMETKQKFAAKSS